MSDFVSSLIVEESHDSTIPYNAVELIELIDKDEIKEEDYPQIMSLLEIAPSGVNQVIEEEVRP